MQEPEECELQTCRDEGIAESNDKCVISSLVQILGGHLSLAKMSLLHLHGQGTLNARNVE